MQTASATAPSVKVIHHIGLTNGVASPSELLIRVGEYVEFDSKDGQRHDVASGAGNGYGEQHDHTGSGIESDEFGPDEGYLVQFNKVGSYYFHDHFHPDTTISVAVYDPSHM